MSLAPSMAADAQDHFRLQWSSGGEFNLGDKSIEFYDAFLDGRPVPDLRRVELKGAAGTRSFMRRPAGWNGTLPLPTSLELSSIQNPWSIIEVALQARGISEEEWQAALGPWRREYRVDPATGDLEAVLIHRLMISSPYDEREFAIRERTGSVQAERSILQGVAPKGDQIVGEVLGRVPENDLPFGAAPFVDLPLGLLSLLPVGQRSVVTAEQGEFVIPGASALVLATVDGPLYTVENNAGPEGQFLGVLVAGSPQIIVFNQNPNELATAETAAFQVASRGFFFLEQLSPGFGPAQNPLLISVNLEGSCYSFYSPILQVIGFTLSGAVCPNTAYGSVVAHEYFHHIENYLPLSTEGYAEGIADTFAAYLTGSSLIGPGFYGPGSSLRNLDGISQFPFPSTDPIEQGLPLAESFWHMREKLIDSEGSEAGALLAGQLWLGSVLVGEGVISSDVVLDLLLLDDDDGDLANGTPHFAEITEAFQMHGFSIPVLPVGALSCEVQEHTVFLTWTNPQEYDAISIRLDGVPLITVSGNATEFAHAFAPRGLHSYWVIGISDGVETTPATCFVEVPTYLPFLRGDATADGFLDISDGITILNYLFEGTPAAGCLDAIDADDNGEHNVADAIVVLLYLFASGNPLPMPFPEIGFDPTIDQFICQ
ncbi:MAG: hypothetical protein V3T77_09915 [Planctomycetota bacterium]